MSYSLPSTGDPVSYASRRKLDPDRVSTPARLAKQREWRINHPINYLLSLARCRAKAKGIKFDLTVADLGAPPKICPVLGLELRYFGRSKKNATDTATLDRIENSRGYVAGNVIIVSARANELKRDATPNELRQLADFYGRLN
jgi:hypothetical protein